MNCKELERNVIENKNIYIYICRYDCGLGFENRGEQTSTGLKKRNKREMLKTLLGFLRNIAMAGVSLSPPG